MREGCVMRSEDMCCKGRVNGVNLNGYGKKEGVLISEGRCFFYLAYWKSLWCEGRCLLSCIVEEFVV